MPAYRREVANNRYGSNWFELLRDQSALLHRRKWLFDASAFSVQDLLLCAVLAR